MSKVRIAAVNFITVPDKEKNLKKYLTMIDQAADQGADLIAFPELSLTGMHPKLSMKGIDYESACYFYQNAELIPEGKSVQALIGKAKEKKIYISWTMCEQDPVYYDKFYNTAVLVGPEGYVGKQRKIHQPGTEELTMTAGKSLEVFDTTLGKIGMMVCYDKSFPEDARCLKMLGAQIVICMAAWTAVKREETDSSLLAYLNFSRYLSSSDAQVHR